MEHIVATLRLACLPPVQACSHLRNSFNRADVLLWLLLQALVATVDCIDAHSLLQGMAGMSLDGSRLVDMACIAFASVTMDQITGLREAYRTTVAAEKRDVPAPPPFSLWPTTTSIIQPRTQIERTCSQMQ